MELSENILNQTTTRLPDLFLHSFSVERHFLSIPVNENTSGLGEAKHLCNNNPPESII